MAARSEPRRSASRARSAVSARAVSTNMSGEVAIHSGWPSAVSRLADIRPRRVRQAAPALRRSADERELHVRVPRDAGTLAVPLDLRKDEAPVANPYDVDATVARRYCCFAATVARR